MSITIKEEINLILTLGELEEVGVSYWGPDPERYCVPSSRSEFDGGKRVLSTSEAQVPRQVNSPKYTRNKSMCRLLWAQSNSH